MKNILLTPRLEKIEGFGEIREQLDVVWGRLIIACGFMPMICPTEADKAQLLQSVAIDGVLLTGGNHLGSVSHDDLSIRRDRSETDLVKAALKKNLPVLGVCRGMQFLGEYFGCRIEEVDTHVRREHPVVFESGSRFFGAYQGTKQVKSFHHYGIRKVGDQLVPVATGDDGTIEAFEHAKLHVAAIMWHPERVNPFDREDVAFIRRFFERTIR